MEGNIEMPQVFLSITLRGLEAGLSSEDPKAAFSTLLDPIPDDERHEARVRKAAAQHAAHDIGKPLRLDAVRRIEVIGHRRMLNMLSRTLIHGEVFPVTSTPNLVGPDEDWATPLEKAALEEVLEQLTPEHIDLLRRTVGVTNAVLDEPEVKELLKERKELYRGYKHVPKYERGAIHAKSQVIATEVAQRIFKQAALLAPHESEEEILMTSSFVQALGDNFLPILP